MNEAGVSQKGLAERTGLKQSAISAYCNGKGLPSVEALLALAVFFDRSMEWLIGSENQKSDIAWRRRAENAEARAKAAEEKLEALKKATLTLGETVEQITKIFVS